MQSTPDPRTNPLEKRRSIFRRQGAKAFAAFGLAVASFVMTGALLSVAGLERASIIAIGTSGFGLGTVLAVTGVVLGLAALMKPGSSPVGVTAFVLVGPLLGGLLMTLLGLLLTLLASAGFRRGRQLRRLGHVFLPPVDAGPAWSKLGPELDCGAADREALADQWRENGRTEHASVAAFAHLTLDLIALGAPPRLIIAAQRDALDEIRHTELCFSLARSLDGRALSPGAFPDVRSARTLSAHRRLALAHLAVDSLVDGAFHEGLSARMIAKLVPRCEVPAIRSILKELAADEGRHAASGWDVVEWCIAEGGAPVLSALEGAALGLPEVAPSRQSVAGSGAWEPFGIHGDALQAEEYAKMRRDLLRRLNALINVPALADAA